MEFIAQMGALVGTSAVLYYFTQPTTTQNHHSHHQQRNNTTTTTTTTTNNNQHAVVVPLRGIQRYSSYHRIRYHNMISQSTGNSTGNNNSVGTTNHNQSDKYE